MKKFIIIMSFFGSLFGTVAQTSEFITILDKEAYQKAIESDSVQLVDVRTLKEYNAGHIKDAINIDYFDQDNFSKAFDKLNKEKPVYLYCRSGNRSQKAAQILVELGFKEIYDLKGGYLGW